MDEVCRIGLIGLGVMGRSLALNIADHGFRVAAYNRHTEKVDRLLADYPHENLRGCRSAAELAGALAPPRLVVSMVEAGPAVDAVIAELRPLLVPGDVIIDGGNSLFLDTRRRRTELAAVGFEFVGLGVSGGEEGARRGPSLMPGGSAGAYELVRPALEAVAARTDSGPCVTRVGEDGAGHFVKMVHNGIEYGDMQLIAESYDVMRKVLGFSAGRIAEVFAEWERGPLASYLVGLTAEVLAVKDAETGRPLVDRVRDAAGSKGTGRWTVETALDLGVPVPTIMAALFARSVSGLKEEREAAAGGLPGPAGKFSGDPDGLIADLGAALYASKMCSYAQGMRLIRTGAARYGWEIDLREIARIWKGGCIIRARLLDLIMTAYEQRPDLADLMLAEEFRTALTDAQAAWRSVIATASRLGVPVPAHAMSLAYYDSYRSALLPQNLTQAQRDAFGAHTYQRLDRPGAGPWHSDWSGRGKK
jgi:6-phosphogluconate dehydrogenase